MKKIFTSAFSRLTRKHAHTPPNSQTHAADKEKKSNPKTDPEHSKKEPMTLSNYNSNSPLASTDKTVTSKTNDSAASGSTSQKDAESLTENQNKENVGAGVVKSKDENVQTGNENEDEAKCKNDTSGDEELGATEKNEKEIIETAEKKTSHPTKVTVPDVKVSVVAPKDGDDVKNNNVQNEEVEKDDNDDVGAVEVEEDENWTDTIENDNGNQATVQKAKMRKIIVKRKVLLVVLDGFGEAEVPDPRPKGNAIVLAGTPNITALRKKYPFSLVEACGEAVGLVAGGMGGSEIGHFAIGAGRVVPQTKLQIDWSIKDKSFFDNVALKRAFRKATKIGEESEREGSTSDVEVESRNKSLRKLHLMGMISDAGVHSHMDHLFALLQWVKMDKVKACYLHCIADGRDVEARSVMRFLNQIEAKINELDLNEVVKFGTLIGRFYAMDRDNNWDRIHVCYDLLTRAKGDELVENDMKHIEDKVQEFYDSEAKDTSDYFLPPIICDKEGVLTNDDAVIFFNYRTDRPRQLTEAFMNEKFSEFDVLHDAKKLTFLTMGPYSDIDNQDAAKEDYKEKVAKGLKPHRLDSIKYNIIVGFPTPVVYNNLGTWLAMHQVKQLRIAETEKYAHVTYFFNSQSEERYDLEDRILVPSKKCNSFAEIPEMSAREITDEVVKAIDKNEHDLIVVNYANADLVGHTGKLEETIQAIKVLDECIGKIVEQCEKSDGQYVLVLTADHGNAEDMIYDDGSEKVSHSMNKVIFLVGNYETNTLKLNDGGLADVAPTVLEIMGIPQPEEMTGQSLIKH